MKLYSIYFIYFIINLFIYRSKCEDYIIPTNYTLIYLSNMEKVLCETDEDCPEFSNCETFKGKDENQSVCKFGSFLCPEKPTENCIFVNTNVYDMDKESMRKGFPEDTKPILKTCPDDSLFISSGTTPRCNTEKCSKDDDCFSGKCSLNKCVYIDYIYRCEGNNNNNYIKCGKTNNMECIKSSECYSKNCNHGHCEKKDRSKKVITMILIFILIALLICLIFIYKYNKNKNIILKDLSKY